MTIIYDLSVGYFTDKAGLGNIDKAGLGKIDNKMDYSKLYLVTMARDILFVQASIIA